MRFMRHRRRQGRPLADEHMSPYYSIVYSSAIPLALLGDHVSAILAYGAIRQNYIDSSADLHPVSCLRQADWSVIWMAQSLSRVSFYKVIAAATMCVCSCAKTIIQRPSFRDVNVASDVAASDPLVLVQRLHPLSRFRPCRTAIRRRVAGTRRSVLSWQWRHGPWL